MSYAELLEKLQSLPSDKQAEVFDFVEFLSARFSPGSRIVPQHDWSNAEFSIAQALRGMDDEPDIYTQDDIKEKWL